MSGVFGQFSVSFGFVNLNLDQIKAELPGEGVFVAGCLLNLKRLEDDGLCLLPFGDPRLSLWETPTLMSELL